MQIGVIMRIKCDDSGKGPRKQAVSKLLRSSRRETGWRWKVDELRDRSLHVRVLGVRSWMTFFPPKATPFVNVMQPMALPAVCMLTTPKLISSAQASSLNSRLIQPTI